MNSIVLKTCVLGLTVALLVPPPCAGSDEPPVQGIDSPEYRAKLEADLSSRTWQLRHEALTAAESLGWNGRDLVARTLQDRSDVVRRSAEAWFIGHGERAIDYLAQEIRKLENDSGRDPSGLAVAQHHRSKSLAGTLWLVLAKGIPRERCFEVMKTLVRNPSPTVRGTVLFTAASLRTERFLHFFEVLANDTNPLVRKKYRESLVHLLVLAWFSTPELDEPSVARALALLEPELVSILEENTPALFVPGPVLGELLGRDPLPFHKDRFISLLENAIPKLSDVGAARAGKAIEQQCWAVKVEGKYTSALWARDKKELMRDEKCVNDAYRRLFGHLEQAANEQLANKYMAALSSFPLELYDARLTVRFFSAKPTGSSASSRAAVQFYAKSLATGDSDLQETALRAFEKNLTQPVEEGAVAAAIVGLDGLQSTDPQKNERLRRLLESQTDRFFSLRKTANLKTLCFFTEFFLHLDDARYFDLFEQVWSHRYSEDPDDEAHLSRIVRVLANDKKTRPGTDGKLVGRNNRVVPHLLGYAVEVPKTTHSGLKAICIYNLLGALGEYTHEFLTDQIFERVMERVRDPDEHPRARAAFAELLAKPSLSMAQQATLREVYIELSRPPYHFNLRAKACWNLGKAREPRVVPAIYALMLEEEAPMWKVSNGLYGLFNLEAKPSEKDLRKVKAGARSAVEFLEFLLVLYEKPEAEVKITHLGDDVYPGEIAVVYRMHPPALALQSLRDLTGQDFGYDIDAWKRWLNN